MIRRRHVEQTDLAGEHAATDRDIEHGRQRIRRRDDQLGLCEFENMIQFAGLAPGVRTHVHTPSADNTEEQGGVQDLHWRPIRLVNRHF